MAKKKLSREFINVVRSAMAQVRDEPDADAMRDLYSAVEAGSCTACDIEYAADDLRRLGKRAAASVLLRYSPFHE